MSEATECEHENDGTLRTEREQYWLKQLLTRFDEKPLESDFPDAITFAKMLTDAERIEAENERLIAERDDVTRQRDELVAQMVEVFGWSDDTYLHASLHLKNAVRSFEAFSGITAKRDEWKRVVKAIPTDDLKALVRACVYDQLRTPSYLTPAVLEWAGVA